MKSPIHTVEFLGDGMAIVRRANGVETMVFGVDVPEFLLAEDREWRDASLRSTHDPAMIPRCII